MCVFLSELTSPVRFSICRRQWIKVYLHFMNKMSSNFYWLVIDITVYMAEIIEYSTTKHNRDSLFHIRQRWALPICIKTTEFNNRFHKLHMRKHSNINGIWIGARDNCSPQRRSWLLLDYFGFIHHSPNNAQSIKPNIVAKEVAGKDWEIKENVRNANFPINITNNDICCHRR